jgi:aspartate/methionine/tyrosine aminotransferase
MRMPRFHMERTQCLYEKDVRWNLSESGVEPLKVEELLGGDFDSEALLGQSLKYPESNGSALLRERIALYYPGARTENVLVTTGCSEANYTTLWSLLEKSGRAAVMLPNYLQSWGLARGYAERVDAYHLGETRERPGRRWALDVESLERAVTKKTRVVMVTNPNNPTGAVLTEAEMDAIVRAARRVGAWIVSDEVYRGAELGRDTPSPTFWGRSARVIVTGGLSKAFGLPGLRIGWIVAPPKTTERLWAYQDYTTLTPTMLSDRLARAALEPARREAILERTRAILRRQLPPVERWIASHGDRLDHVSPVAGAIVFVRYHYPIGSVELFDRLRLEKSVLVTPGAHFGVGRYVRIGYGYDADKTLQGLRRVDELLESLSRRPSRASRRVAAAVS